MTKMYFWFGFFRTSIVIVVAIATVRDFIHIPRQIIIQIVERFDHIRFPVREEAVVEIPAFPGDKK